MTDRVAVTDGINAPRPGGAAISGRPLSFWAASRRIFDLSLGEMLWSRRTIFMALVVGGPVLLALIVRVLESFGMPALRVNGQRVGGMGVFGIMIWMLFLRFAIPILGVFYGTALMADEVEDKTITYLFTRPVPRGAVLFGKYLAYLACTSLVVLPAVMLAYFLLVPPREVPGHVSAVGDRPGPPLCRVGRVRCAVCLCRGLFQTAAGHRAGVRDRVGTDGDGPARLYEALHGRLLPAVTGAAQHAIGWGGQHPPGDVQGYAPGHGVATFGWPSMSWFFCILRPKSWIVRSTSSSSKRLALPNAQRLVTGTWRGCPPTRGK